MQVGFGENHKGEERGGNCWSKCCRRCGDDCDVRGDFEGVEGQINKVVERSNNQQTGFNSSIILEKIIEVKSCD